MAFIDLMNLEKKRINKTTEGKFNLFYGLPKIGKTTLAAQFPKTLLLAFEPGYNALDDLYVTPIHNWEDFIQVKKQLCSLPKLKEKYEIIAIDTVDIAWKYVINKVVTDNGVTKIGDVGYGQGYTQAEEEFRSAISDLAQAGYGINFITHSQTKINKEATAAAQAQAKIEADKNGTKEKDVEPVYQIRPSLQEKPFDIVNKLVDNICYIHRKPNEKPLLFFRETPTFWAGSRYHYIKKGIEFSYENFLKAVGDAVEAQIAASGKTAVEEKRNDFFSNQSFESMMTEVKSLFVKYSSDPEIREQFNNILQTVFEKEDIKFSHLTEKDYDKLKETLIKIKGLIN